MSFNCAIVDDDEMSRQMVAKLVERDSSLKLVAICKSAIEARDVMAKVELDILFLDVEMPELTGIELIRTLKVKPEIILISSREKYAVDGFDYEVTDFLLKPVQLDRFIKAVDKAKANLTEEKTSSGITSDTVFVKSNGQMIGIKLNEILWLEAYGDYVNIYTSKDRFIVHGTMKAMDNKLPGEQFMRVHRSYIIRIDKIKAIEDTVIAIDKKLIPIGDSFRSDLLARLNVL